MALDRRGAYGEPLPCGECCVAPSIGANDQQCAIGDNVDRKIHALDRCDDSIWAMNGERDCLHAERRRAFGFSGFGRGLPCCHWLLSVYELQPLWMPFSVAVPRLLSAFRRVLEPAAGGKASQLIELAWAFVLWCLTFEVRRALQRRV